MRGLKPKLTAIDGGLSKVPAAPRDLDAEARAEWRKAAKQLVDKGFLHTSHLATLELFAIAMGQVRKLQPIANREPAVIATANGSMKTNPTHTMLARYMTVAKNCAAELGLTPAGQHRKGLKQPEGGQSDDYWSRLGL